MNTENTEIKMKSKSKNTIITMLESIPPEKVRKINKEEEDKIEEEKKQIKRQELFKDLSKYLEGRAGLIEMFMGLPRGRDNDFFLENFFLREMRTVLALNRDDLSLVKLPNGKTAYDVLAKRLYEIAEPIHDTKMDELIKANIRGVERWEQLMNLEEQERIKSEFIQANIGDDIDNSKINPLSVDSIGFNYSQNGNKETKV